jgi:surfeit locus 1 family protein
MKIGAYHFKPGLWPTIAVICLFPLLLSLGNWQLHRADEKRALRSLEEQRLKGDEVTITPEWDLQGLKDYIFRKVRLKGDFLKHHYLLDNQIYEGRVGYDVFSPFQLQAGGEIILVNRGWIPMNESRKDIPPVTTPQGILTLHGTLSRPPGKLIKLVGYDTDTSGWPRVVQQINVKRIASQLGRQVSPYVVALNKDSKAVYQIHWVPYVDGPAKHVSYAVQWFVMASVLMFLYIWLNMKREKNDLEKTDDITND